MMRFKVRFKTNYQKINYKLNLIRKLKLLAILIVLPFIMMAQKTDKPNILVIMGDDIGIPNLSAYGHGMMGYQTPNIDRIANEGIMFTDYYGEQSCTAGRSAFITGQHIIRTGMSKVGLPGAKVGLHVSTSTLGDLLKTEGYATGQFGKNHFGDQDEYLPTKHGFDEFFGNLYHLNAEEEPENVDWPANDAGGRVPRPRGVLQASADGPIKDTGPLTKKRMETVDDEFMAAAVDFMERKTEEGRTFKNHLDGYNMLPLWSGKTDKNPREYYIYGTDAAEISAIRFAERWKLMYMEQKAYGQDVWIYKLEPLKAPWLYDLRMDPFEKARETNAYHDWWAHRVYMLGWGGSYVVQFKNTFKDYPAAQKPASWNVTEMK